jgi:hypothetical protein
MLLDNTSAAATLGIDDEFLTSPTRIIGMGVEVHNVSSELNKQGTLTVYQVPQNQDVVESFTTRQQTLDGVKYIQSTQNCRILNGFTSTISEAMLYEGSIQWEAADGVYTVIPFSTAENSAAIPEYETPLIYESDRASERIHSLNVSQLWIGPWATGSIDGDNIIFEPHMYTPMHSKGVILSGLSKATILQVNMNIYLETFPILADASLVTLARPSSASDKIALECISRASKNMPIGVPVAQNGLGDFFLEVVETVTPWLAAGASVIFPEFSPAIGLGAKAITSAASAMKSKQPQAPAAMQKPRPKMAPAKKKAAPGKKRK